MQGALLAAPAAVRCDIVHSSRKCDYTQDTTVPVVLLSTFVRPMSGADAKRSAQDGVDNSQSPLVQRLLESSAKHKEAYDKERLDSYYRRNLREFFANPASVRGLSEDTKRRISEWLEKNPA